MGSLLLVTALVWRLITGTQPPCSSTAPRLGGGPHARPPHAPERPVLSVAQVFELAEWHGRSTTALTGLREQAMETSPDLGFSSLERVTRIELALSAWEADVLPLNYTRAHLQLSVVAATESACAVFAHTS